MPNSATTVVGGIILDMGKTQSIYYDVPIFIASGFYAVSITLFYLVFKDVKPSG